MAVFVVSKRVGGVLMFVSLMRNLFLLLTVCAFTALAGDVAEKTGKEAQQQIVPQDKVYVVITNSGSDEKLKVFYERITGNVPATFGGMKAELVGSKKDADPAKCGMLLIADFNKSVKFKFSQGDVSTYTWCYYGKYKLYESRDGKWKSCDSGKLRIHNRCYDSDQLAAVVLAEMTSIKVRAKNSKREAVIVSGKIKNKSNVTLKNIGILADMNGDVPFVKVKPYYVIKELAPDQSESFEVEVPLKAEGKTKKASKLVTATFRWKNTYVAAVNMKQQ